MLVGTWGCKGAKVAEVRGKTGFGPEYRHRSNDTNDIRYNTIQGLELKWDNGWTTSATYRYRTSSEGQYESDMLSLFEVGYPIWKAPKKPEAAEKTAERVEDLERELAELRGRVASMLNAASTPVATAADASR